MVVSSKESVFMMNKIEYVIVVENLDPKDREKFLRGFMHCFLDSKTEFNPPHEYIIRSISDDERKKLDE
jgi:hypothetical protein